MRLHFRCGLFPEFLAALFMDSGVAENLELSNVRRDVDQDAIAVFRSSHSELFEASTSTLLEIFWLSLGDMDADLPRADLLRIGDRRDDPIMIELREEMLHGL